METRASTRQSCWLIGDTLKSIEGNKLPSNGQVLRRLYDLSRLEGKSIKDSATVVSTELQTFWDKARIPTKRFDHIIDKIKKLHLLYDTLRKESNKDHPKCLTKRNDFLVSLDDLFDIAHSDAMKITTIQQEKDFLEMQREKGSILIIYTLYEYFQKLNILKNTVIIFNHGQPSWMGFMGLLCPSVRLCAWIQGQFLFF